MLLQLPSRLGHYEILVLLGSGGMGDVYKAYDLSLKRYVALKLLRSDMIESSERFLQEARSQARVQHEHVCKVYETGQEQGARFIAMQLIEGETLSYAAKEMTFEQKLRVMKRTAEALHAAHREGLIHRDVKPANILVEKTESGEWKPYVLDFGLAREQAAAGFTLTGMLIGTPGYMAPEQVRGEIHELDRRTDVYALGVTLYEILCGKLPFSGDTAADMLVKIVNDEPPLLRKVDRRIPADLETIVMKCLEKEPHRRYESAKVLADDLQRYLDGEPIAARPAGWVHRWLKRAKKNKAATAMLAAGVVTTGVLLGMLLWVQWRASAQTRYNSEFGQEVRYIQSMLRSVYMAPLHDVRSERRRAQERLLRVEARIKEGGRFAYGPGQYALGEGYLALRQFTRARKHLQAAWDSGYHDPGVAYSLGQVLGVLYQHALEDAERIANSEARLQQKQKIEKEFRDPAVQFLKQAKAESLSYLEGLIALYERQYDLALEKARVAVEQRGWLYETLQLQGDVHINRGREAFQEGEYERAKKEFEEAGIFYGKAMEIGRSEEVVYLSECERWIALMGVDSVGGKTPSRPFENAMGACEKAIAVNPDGSEAFGKKSAAYVNMGVYQLYHSAEDPRDVFKKSIVMSQEALKRNPEDKIAFRNLGTAYGRIGEYELEHSVNPQESLQKAIEYCRKLLETDPTDPAGRKALGNSYLVLGIYQLTHGDPRAALNQAIEEYEKAIQMNPRAVGTYSNEGLAYYNLAMYQMKRGEDPRPSFRKSVERHRKALEINPKNYPAHLNLGNTYLHMGKHQLMIGQDPVAFLELAIQKYQEGLKINSNMFPAYTNLGMAYEYIAEYRLLHEADASEALEKARVALDQSSSIDPNYYETHSVRGMVEILAARHALQRQKSPNDFLETAQRMLRRSLELNQTDADAHAKMALVYRWKAESLLQQRKAIEPLARIGLGWAQKAVALDPQNGEAMAAEGVLYLLLARQEKLEAKRKEWAQRAKTTLDRALKVNRLLSYEYEAARKEAASY